MVVLWNDICEVFDVGWVLCVKIFGGKVVLGYVVVKEIIYLINSVVKVINVDLKICDVFQIVYLENYNVIMVEVLILVVDLFEQILIVGKEVFGIGNMKFVFNGVLMIGILDGVNVEICDCVGVENFFLFGLMVLEVVDCWKQFGYVVVVIVVSLKFLRVLEQIEFGCFFFDDLDCFKGFVKDLCIYDYFLVICDFDDYFVEQRKVDIVYFDQEVWSWMVVLNMVNVGWFFFDWMILGYVSDIWGVQSVGLLLFGSGMVV